MEIENNCPLDRLLRMLTRSWTLHILVLLRNNGPTRYGELKRHLKGISSKVMTERLRMLEDDNIICRDIEETIPPKVTYLLTDKGHELDQALIALEHTAAHWQT